MTTSWMIEIAVVVTKPPTRPPNIPPAVCIDKKSDYVYMCVIY